MCIPAGEADFLHYKKQGDIYMKKPFNYRIFRFFLYGVIIFALYVKLIWIGNFFCFAAGITNKIRQDYPDKRGLYGSNIEKSL